MSVILASASPRRKRLLKRLEKRFAVRVAHVDERIHAGEDFAKAAMRLALLKARAAVDGKSVVIGADTIAYLGKKNFRKTDDEKKARRILAFLRGKTHFVVTGVAVLFPNGKRAGYFARAAVKMKKFSEKELASYLRSGEWRGRAGCYDISGKGRKLVRSVRGERETVIGLPLKRLKKVLKLALLTS